MSPPGPSPTKRSYAPIYFSIGILTCLTLIFLSKNTPIKLCTYLGDDYPREVPESFPERKMTMQLEDSRFSLYSDDDWGSDLPRTWKGFMSLGPDNRPFTLSLYHQLHCLDAIRVSFVLNGTDAEWHVQHCLRYLRQILLCHADTTVEPGYWLRADPEGAVEPGSHGIGVEHSCPRDWEKVNEWAEAHPVVLPDALPSISEIVAV